ncbi:hypothetical protein SEVIR_8G239701v4 [Setaria viridis]
MFSDEKIYAVRFTGNVYDKRLDKSFCDSRTDWYIDDDEEVQTGEGLRHGQRGRTLQEQRVGGEEPRPGCNEPEVQDDTRGVVAGQPHVIRQPGHALLVPLQQAQPVRL